MSGYWEHFHHGADIGVRGYGGSLQEAFEYAARALTGVVTDPQLVEPTTTVAVVCEAPDRELLLVEWLNMLLYEMAVRRMLFSDFKVECSPNSLEAEAVGEAVDVRKHRPAVEVKGATYTELRVALDDDGVWMAQCVVDV